MKRFLIFLVLFVACIPSRFVDPSTYAAEEVACVEKEPTDACRADVAACKARIDACRAAVRARYGANL